MKFARPISDTTPNITNPFSAKHKGTDYGYADGTPVYASESGKIVAVKFDEARQWLANTPSDPFPNPRQLRTEDYGNYIKVDHGNGYETLYAHLKTNTIKYRVGESVKKGQGMALVGSTGNSSGSHLHWEIRRKGVVIDPVPLLESGFSAYFDTPLADNNKQTVTLDGEKFKELVGKSTEYDKFAALGYTKVEIVLKKIEEVENENRGLKTQLKEVSEDNVDYLRKLEAFETRDATAIDTGLVAERKLKDLEDEVGQIAFRVGIAPYSYLEVIEAIDKLKIPVEEQMKPVLKDRNELYHFIFDEGYGIFKRIRPQAESYVKRVWEYVKSYVKSIVKKVRK